MSAYLDRLNAYAQRITDGTETAGPWERLAVARYLRDLARQGTPEFPYVLDDRLGARECYFLELLPHIKGEWAKPVYVDGKFSYAKLRLEDWQIFIEFQLFGWVHMETRLRRFRRSYEEIARKNAKSTRGAGRMLYLLTADGEPGSHCYSAATTGDQAREVFDVARNMSLREPEFLQRFGVDVGKHDITVPTTASSFKPLNAEGSTLDGLNVHGALVDEVHAHKRRALWDVLDTATGQGPRWMSVRPFNLGSAANANSPRAALSAYALADNDDAESLALWTVPSPDGSSAQQQLGGPSVVQAAINGDTELSQQFTLLSAGGSKVSFGPMTLVPNGDDVLYVRPVYVTATGKDATQQLVEVLAYADGLVGRGANLNEAINNLREPVRTIPVTPADRQPEAVAPG